MKGIGGHQSHRMIKDEWLTPPEVIQALGPFDLDPCSPEVRPWDTAHNHYTKSQDGLSLPWFGFVWCNPPYGQEAWRWLDKLAAHRSGIGLIFARTETDGFRRTVWDKADAILFLHGRLTFHHVDGSKASANGGAPSALIAYGPEAVKRLSETSLPGSFVSGWKYSPEPKKMGLRCDNGEILKSLILTI